MPPNSKTFKKFIGKFYLIEIEKIYFSLPKISCYMYLGDTFWTSDQSVLYRQKVFEGWGRAKMLFD